MNLTPETRLWLHLAKAQEFWREDRLDLALAAIKAALQAGIPSSNWYDLQRTIEAEWGARQAARRLRVEEFLILETDPPRWGRDWPGISRAALRAMRLVTEVLRVRWAKPVLITLIPAGEWVEFLHARYGYYADRSEVHKVCLPPTAVRPLNVLRAAARHELTHAAISQLAGDTSPRWMNEGLAVWMEGHAMAPARKLRLAEISAGFESYTQEVGSRRSQLCYAGAGDFVGRLIQLHGMPAVRAFLLRMADGRREDRAFEESFGVSRSRAESVWRAS